MVYYVYLMFEVHEGVRGQCKLGGVLFCLAWFC